MIRQGKDLLYCGDFVTVRGNKGKVISIRKCQPDGECVYGLDGIWMSMITDKIIVVVNIAGRMIEVKGSEVNTL